MVGLGQQAEKIAQAIQSSDNGELLAVASPDKNRARLFAKTHHAEKYFTSYDKLLRQPEIDAVFVSSPNHQHRIHAVKSLRAKKHVLCEKPMALNLKDGYAMLRSAKISGVKLGVGFHLRHHPVHQEAKKIIRSGKLGKLALIEMHWSVGSLGTTDLPAYKSYMAWRNDPRKSGGGAIMARGVHLFDLLRFITGLEVTEAAAYTDTRPGQPIDMLAAGILRLKGDTISTVVTSRRIPQAINNVTIYGSKGRLILRDALTTDSSGTLEFVRDKKKVIKTFRRYDVYRKEIEDFGDLMHGLKGPGATGEDGIKTISITEAFLTSAHHRRTLKVRTG